MLYLLMLLGACQTARKPLDLAFNGLWCAHSVSVFSTVNLSALMWYCSPHKDATSLSNLFLLLPTGSIPGPIAFGSLIDISCTLWQDQCGHQGSCYHYHNAAMSQYTLVAGIIYKVMLYILLGLLLRSQEHSAKLLALYKTVCALLHLIDVCICACLHLRWKAW